ncbi:MAG: PAS domain-containing protein, partial [Proteobacteria bacterium]|nr:PAS domain-containing protein [Pseudomonadota bacterium]
MSRIAIALKKPRRRLQVDSEAVLNALATAVLVVDSCGAIVYVNGAAEHFFKNSAAYLTGQALDSLLPADSPLFSLIGQVRGQGSSIAEYGVTLHTPYIGTHDVNIQAAPLPESEDLVMIALQEHSIADKIDRQLTHRGAARSVTALAEMLAHEVKNPLSGIRGAAQLLEQNAMPEDRLLTRLICDETDRICALVDRMDVFTDNG